MNKKKYLTIVNSSIFVLNVIYSIIIRVVVFKNGVNLGNLEYLLLNFLICGITSLISLYGIFSLAIAIFRERKVIPRYLLRIIILMVILIGNLIILMIKA